MWGGDLQPAAGRQFHIHCIIIIIIIPSSHSINAIHCMLQSSGSTSITGNHQLSLHALYFERLLLMVNP
jgi:hypothetical protein